ncbi:extracellular solute-binding protein [Bacillus sp. SD088]|uniref:extracellular solute-binding protein n=1 Tax=Bacillus sp. SD088 TaxID=2782012 RepID=UPI001A96C176|nr:extracellular solute-binding protein [Bacillus sp. SD088]MBO0993328.1 extracellular solute-binding protein [Bacillus sp. SD088]
MQNKITLFLALLLFVLLTACSQNGKVKVRSEGANNNVNETGFPIVDEEINLEIFAGQAPATNPNWNDIMVFNEYEKMTNMNITWKMVPHSGLEEKRNLALGSGNLPDAFHSASMPIADIMKYGEQGVFIPLNDLIDEYAPNFKALMEENPEIREAVTMPDGNIYGFPQMADPEFLSYRMGPKPFVRKDWLEALDMDVPKTTEEYYQYLKAVKEGEPSGGEVDEIPYGAPYIDPLVSYVRGAFGLANKGSGGGYMDLDPESGNYRFWPASEQYKEFLEYLHKLYSEELIEQNVYSIDHMQYLANQKEGKYGSIIWYSPMQIMGENLGGQYISLPQLEGPHGDKIWTTFSDAVLNPGAFLITSENEYPEATVRWIDHFYGDEGLLLFFMGIEGETYEKDENGEAVYMDHILNSKEGLSNEEEWAKYLTFPGGGFPSMTTLKYFQGAESKPDEMASSDLLAPDLVKEPWLSIRHTNEETSKLNGFGADIEKYVVEMRDKFIVGTEPLSKYDEYVKTLERMGLEDYMKLKIEAIER